MPKIFISYVRENKTVVRKLENELSKYPNVNVWLDLKTVEPGDYFMQEVEQAIEKADYYVPCFSNFFVEKINENTNFYMLDELRIAKRTQEKKGSHKKWALPVFLENCILPNMEDINW